MTTTGEAIPKTQLAAVSHSKEGGTVIETIPVVQPEDMEFGRVLIKVLYSGVCHSDLSMVDDHFALRVPRPCIAGHEGTGIVVAMNDPLCKIKIGDRVAVKFVANSCNQCQTCLEGDEVFCDDAKTVGRTAPGSFQQYCYTYTSQLTRIPDNLDLPAAAPILCAGVTVWSALKKGNLQPGQWIAIPGAGGGLGSLAIQYARFRGLNVIAIDTGDEKKALCLKLGARVFVDFKKEQDLVVAIKAATPDGKGPQAALVTAAQIGAYHLAMAYIRRGGYVIGVGLPADGAVFQTDLLGTVAQRKNFVTSFIGNRLDAIEALQVAADGHVVAPIRVVPFDQLNATYEEMRQGKISGRVVLDLWK